VGKTQLSLLIARALGGEVISMDSMQVYRGMDIGTAKPSRSEREAIVHHLIDSRDLDETFNVVESTQEGYSAIKEILDKGAVPLVVGGTGFYIHSLIYGPPQGPPANLQIRSRLESEMDLLGTEMLYARVKELDPVYAASITSNDKQKIIRALEIMAISSKKVSDLPLAPARENYDFRCWFLYASKEALYPRIEMRCDEMLASGLVDEVTRLSQEGLRGNSTASQAIGYRQCLEYLDSAKTQEDWDRFVSMFKQASRRYAKRQFTWFRKEPLFRWLNRDALSVEQVAEMIIQDYELRF
jgi:tRNA dimethylallyltransferase